MEFQIKGTMSNRFVLGIDLGGTKIAAALVAQDHRILWEEKILTEADAGIEHVLGRLKDACDKASAIAPITGISLAMPGPLDIPKGLVIKAPTLGWDHVPIVKILENMTGLKVYLENDANAAALGEQIYGAGHGVSDLIYITVSTGIGAGFVVNNRIIHGKDGGAGEIGHISVLKDGPLCVCGQYGCLEALSSGTAITRTMRERLRQGETSLVTEMAAGDLSQINMKIIGEAAKNGDPLALEIIATAMEYLGISIANLVNIFNPGMVLIGGGVSNLGELLFERVKAEVRKRAYPSFVNGLYIGPPSLGERAGVLGSAVIALRDEN